MKFNKPSFATGYARGQGDSAYPELWQDLDFCMGFLLGPQGQGPRDFSGKHRHGSLSGGFGSDLVWEPTPYGWGLRSIESANTSRITLTSYPIAAPFSWAARLKWSTFTNSWQVLMTQGASVGIFSRASQLIRFETAGTGLYTNNTVNANQWYSVVLTVDAGLTARWYIDGKEDANGAVTSASFNADSMLNDSASETFDGIMAYQMVWRRTLPVTQVRLLYEGATPLTLRRIANGFVSSAPAATDMRPPFLLVKGNYIPID